MKVSSKMAGRDSQQPVLSVRDLHTHFFTKTATVRAVNGVSFDIDPGEMVGLVGESGCGKSVTALSILNLVDAPGRVVDGGITFNGRDIRNISGRDLRRIRGREIAMIFQNPIGALNPVFSIGRQIIESIRTHQQVSRRAAYQESVRLLNRVGIPDADRRMGQYPHQFSGGMAQRVVIAMALANRPKLLIADEPTTALDVTIQAQIVDLLGELNQEFGMAVLHITHNMALVAESCTRTMVMYGGQIAERGATPVVFEHPMHPYTQALLRSVPDLDHPEQIIVPLEGFPPDITREWPGCEFEARCSQRLDHCRTRNPVLRDVEEGHGVRCHLYSAE